MGALTQFCGLYYAALSINVVEPPRSVSLVVGAREACENLVTASYPQLASQRRLRSDENPQVLPVAFQFAHLTNNISFQSQSAARWDNARRGVSHENADGGIFGGIHPALRKGLDERSGSSQIVNNDIEANEDIREREVLKGNENVGLFDFDKGLDGCASCGRCASGENSRSESGDHSQRTDDKFDSKQVDLAHDLRRLPLRLTGLLQVSLRGDRIAVQPWILRAWTALSLLICCIGGVFVGSDRRYGIRMCVLGLCCLAAGLSAY